MCGWKSHVFFLAAVSYKAKYRLQPSNQMNNDGYHLLLDASTGQGLMCLSSQKFMKGDQLQHITLLKVTRSATLLNSIVNSQFSMPWPFSRLSHNPSLSFPSNTPGFQETMLVTRPFYLSGLRSLWGPSSFPTSEFWSALETWFPWLFLLYLPSLLWTPDPGSWL